MGANLRTHWLPNARIEQVQPALDAWLSAKGFEPLEGPSPVWVERLGGRGLVLAENEAGVAICYSEVWSEGDRLIFELARLGPVLLETWLHDSDVWGYRLFRHGETIAAFCSNPRYFGSEEHDEDAIRLGRNGDARLLTETLGIPEKEQALRDLQVRRRVFAESLTDEFAELVGAPALALDYLDWQELGVHELQNGEREVADHRIKAIAYVPRSLPGQRAWDLHRVPSRQVVQPVPGEFVGDPAVITEGMLWTIAVLRALAIPIGLLIRTAALPIGLVLRYRPQWILGRMRAPVGTAGESSLRRALRELTVDEANGDSQGSVQGFVQQGESYVHRGYGVALTPAPGVTIDPSPPHSCLCLLRVDEQVGMLAVRDFHSTEMLLGNLPGEVVEDLHETTPDGLPLRFVACEVAQAKAVALGHRAGQAQRKHASDEPPPPSRIFFAFVQEERFVYLLNMALHERQEASAEALKATLRSFRRVGS
ncbi:MAG TPA: hypothetical protein VGN57_15845 [Pirellulaceae bacterium]|nr:hypothetical protein [Pirellulaceae bacterium]